MAIPGIAAAANIQPASLQMSPSSGYHRHNGHHPSSISDVDAQSSSVAATAKSTGKVGSTVDMTA